MSGESNTPKTKMPETFNIFKFMQDLHDKLLLLNYEHEVTSRYKIKPINRMYFALKTNTGDQYFTFTCLAAWLIYNQCKLNPSTAIEPEQFADPNMIWNGIMEVFGLIKKEVTFTSNSVKQGFGKDVIFVLNCLCDYAIKQKNGVNCCEIDLSKENSNLAVKEDLPDEEDLNEMMDNDSDYEFTTDEQMFTLIDDVQSVNDSNQTAVPTNVSGQATTERYQPVMLWAVNEEAWKQQVNRILPQLYSNSDGFGLNSIKSDWRWRLNEVEQRRQQLASELDESSGRLKRLYENVQRAVQKLSGRERHIQQQLQTQVEEWSSVRMRMKKATQQYQQINGGVLDKSRRLAELSEQVQRTRNQVDQQAAKLTNGAPLATLRARVRDLQTEIDTIDERIAVANRSLLQIKIQQANDQPNIQNDFSSARKLDRNNSTFMTAPNQISNQR